MSDTPARWQYAWFSKVAGMVGRQYADLNSALQEANEEASKFGANGWEMVNFTTQYVGSSWIIVCFMKRPM
jgi:hypothetical protein